MPIPPGVPTTGPLTVVNAPDTYPTHDAALGLAGLHTVDDLAGLSGISADRRRAGMGAMNRSNKHLYILEADLTTWTDTMAAASSGGYVTPQQFGAIANGVANDTTAVLAATAAAASSQLGMLLFPPGTYVVNINVWTTPDNIVIRFAPGALVIPATYPTASGSAEDIWNGLLFPGNGVIIEGSGQSNFSGRRYDAGYTAGMDISRRLALVMAADKKDITIRNTGFKDAFWGQVYLRRTNNVSIKESLFETSCQMVEVFNCADTTIAQCEVRNYKGDNSGVSPHMFQFQSGQRARILNNKIVNPLSTAGGSSTMVLMNFFGEFDPIIQGNHLGQFDPASTMASSGILIDGGQGGRVVNNQIRCNHGAASYGMAIEGPSSCIVDGNEISGVHTGPASIGAGIHFRNGGIEGVSKPGLIQWRDAGGSEHCKTINYNNRITNNHIDGYNHGIKLDTSDTAIVGNRITGSTFAGIRLELTPAVDDDFFKVATTILAKNITIEDNVVQYCDGTGIFIVGGDNLVVEDNVVRGNNQANGTGDAISTRYTLAGTTAAGSTSTVIQSQTVLTANQYKGFHIYFPTLDVWAVVDQNTASSLTLRDGGVSPAPISGVSFVLSAGILGKVSIINNQLYDDAITGLVIPKCASLDPTQAYAAGTPFFVQTQQGHLFQHNRRIVLKGVLTGGVDCTVKVSHPDPDYCDRYWVIPITPASGTFATTAGPSISAITGTTSYTDAPGVPYQYTTRVTVTGAGGAQFTRDLDNNIWIKPSSANWCQVQSVDSDTSLKLLINQPANWSNQTTLVSWFGISLIKSQIRGYDVTNTPGRFEIRGNQVWGNLGSGGTSPQGFIDLATAPDAIPRIIGNSTTPTLDIGFTQMRFAYTAPTTITDLRDASEGTDLSIICDGNVTFGFASGGTKFKGNGGVNKTPTAGSLANCRFTNGLWYVTFVDV